MVMWAVSVCAVICVFAVVQGAALKGNDPIWASDSRRVYRSYTQSPDVDWNYIADNIIDLTRADIKQTGKTQLTLPNVVKQDSWGFFNVRYKLRAGKGTVGKLTSFRRTGDVLFRTGLERGLFALVPITLDRLRVQYGFYEVKVLGLTISGVLGGTMDTISLVMVIYGELEEDWCSTSLVEAKVEDLGNLSVDITGLGALNGVTSTILEYFVKQRMLGIVSRVESVLLEEIGKIIKEYHCEELHTLFLLVGT